MLGRTELFPLSSSTRTTAARSVKEQDVAPIVVRHQYCVRTEGRHGTNTSPTMPTTHSSRASRVATFWRATQPARCSYGFIGQFTDALGVPIKSVGLSASDLHSTDSRRWSGKCRLCTLVLSKERAMGKGTQEIRKHLEENAKMRKVR